MTFTAGLFIGGILGVHIGLTGTLHPLVGIVVGLGLITWETLSGGERR
ncbi:hypothetical protein [Nonomuraea angiospora]